MKAPTLDRYADDFARLAALPATEREAALAALALDEDESALLRRLLAADANDDTDPLAEMVAAGAASQLAALESHPRLGPYRLLRELGAGGMGTVFLAERIEGGFEQTVAIKLLRGFPTADGLRRLRQERQILAGLDHPNIAHLLDGGETDNGQPWLALEYIDGLPLLDHVARHAPRLSERLALFDAILDAVGQAHQRLVIHRDIKPANVLVNANGQVKLLDFGIARLVDLDSDEDGAQTGSTRVYSAGYASPEQRDGRTVTTASDLYSLGVLLGELVAGTAKPADAELAGILAKASDDDPARRYASAGEFRDDLDRYRAGRPVRAARMTRRYRLRKFAARHRLGVASGLVATLALGLFVWRLDHERGRAVQAEIAAAGDAQRARAALSFLVDAFSAAAPDNALGQAVSVQQLLDHARTRLVAHELDPAVAKPLQRLLGSLYAELGDTTTGAELLAQGTRDAPVANRGEALALALDIDRLADLEAVNGRNDAALAAIEHSAALRQQHAPDDVDEKARTLLARAGLHHHRGEHSKTVAVLRQALQPAPQAHALDLALERTISSKLTMMLVYSGECGEALERSEARSADVSYETISPSERIRFLRAFGLAHTNCGDAQRAETLLRSAIAEQEALTGASGYDLFALVNDLGLALSRQTRYREAVEVLERARTLDPTANARPRFRAIALTNLSAAYERAGDYARALALLRNAGEEMDRSDQPADTEERRVILRGQARMQAFTGDPERAAARLAELREQSRRLDGSDAFEYVVCTLQLAIAERLAKRFEAAETHLREAESGLSSLLPETHVTFAQLMLQHGALAIARGEPARALEEFQRALAHLQRNGDGGVEVAKARADLASAYFALGRRDDAHSQLVEALPLLRERLFPTHVHRASAERLAARMGVP